MIEGIDISSHQGTVDHAAVAGSGMLFCICKATEGQSYVDPRFAENMAAIREVTAQTPYYPGAYHFARPDSVGGAEDGRAEGEDFCDVIEAVCGDITSDFMPPVLDFEKYSPSDYEENIPWITAWLEVVEARLKRRPMIYTGKNVWRYELGNTSLFTNYALWQVDYTDDDEPEDMETDPPWPWTLWQYSGGGEFQHHPPVPGVGVVDVNRFDGTLEDFSRLVNGNPLPPPAPAWPPPPQVVNMYDLRGSYSDLTARCQGLLMAHGYGPDGLTQGGLPDGLSGPKTESALVDFKVSVGLPADTYLTWETWWMLSNAPRVR